ncbi:heparinase, partial [Candidatus Pacearchaeota archaeon]|nr:heparinase [Candidatus Pacearchaeota archaeon]
MIRVDKALLYVRTLRYLRPIQIFGRAWYLLHKPAVRTGPPPATCHSSGRWESPPLRPDFLKGPRDFFLLNKVVGLTSWSPDNLPKLWVYHLHYFDACTSISSGSQGQWLRQLIRDWIQANPPTDGIGWEPYPLSRRIVNWIKGDIAFSFLEEDGLQSLATQARYLLKRCEYYLQGNHLWANGKALFFAGLYFGGHLQSGESSRWL